MNESADYRAHTALRVRAFFLTDRVGHTLAVTIGLTKLFVWWLTRALRRRTRVPVRRRG